MTYTNKEKKLIALAMNGAAQAGEMANAAAAFFKSIRQRRVRYAKMVNGAEPNLELLEQLSVARAANIQLAAERDQAREDFSDLKKQFDYICEYSVVRITREREAYLAHLNQLRSGVEFVALEKTNDALRAKIKALKLKLDAIKLLVEKPPDDNDPERTLRAIAEIARENR